LVELVLWLSKTIKLGEEPQFLLESLRASLLHDLYLSIPEIIELHDNLEQQSHEDLYRFLTIAGTTVAICEGFDGIVSILSLFPVIPLPVILLAGVVFAALSVIVFRGFDLVAIAKNLGVDMEKTPHAIDAFLDQVEQIVKLRAVISICCTKPEHEQDHAVLMEIAAMLMGRYNAIDGARRRYKNDLDAPYLKTAKSLTSAIAGVLFFGSAFFSGQSVFLAIASIFTSSVSSVFWPVFVASFLVGMAAFSIYWFVERPGLESLVSRWLVDLDEDKINALVEHDVVNAQRNELQILEAQTRQTDRLQRRILELSTVSYGIQRQPIEPPSAGDTRMVQRTHPSSVVIPGTMFHHLRDSENASFDRFVFDPEANRFSNSNS
jgi:hypothetical protein